MPFRHIYHFLLFWLCMKLTKALYLVPYVTCGVQIHAEGEAEHAAIGHNAVLSFVPAEHENTLRRAMRDHDRDFSAFYNKLADMLQ